MTLQLSLKGFIADLRFDAFFCMHFLELGVLCPEPLGALDRGRVRATKFGASQADVGDSDVVFTSQVSDGYTGLVLL